MQEKSKLVRYAQAALVILILFGFPAVSYYYLIKGADYRRQALGELGKYGTMPDLRQMPPAYGELPADLNGRMYVVGWIDDAHSEVRTAYGETLERLHLQFDGSDRLRFATIAASNLDSAAVAYFISRFKLDDPDQVSVLRADEQGFASVGRAFALPLEGNALPGTRPLAALVDTSLTIRGYYDLGDEAQTRRLVEHIAMILPLPKERDIVLERDKEM